MTYANNLDWKSLSGVQYEVGNSAQPCQSSVRELETASGEEEKGRNAENVMNVFYALVRSRVEEQASLPSV